MRGLPHGWSLAHGEGDGAYFAMASGPGRARAAKEELFQELAYADSESFWGSFVLETDRRPPDELVARVAGDCALAPSALTFILTPTTSLAGAVQITARVLEVALHKSHEIGFDLSHIVDGVATAPLPAPSPDGVEAMGRTNDAILYGGRVHLSVRGSDEAARALAQKLPSRNSKDYGRSFAEIFKAVEYDFYKIDPALFAPAEVWVSNLDSGSTFHGGALEMGLLQRHWLR